MGYGQGGVVQSAVTSPWAGAPRLMVPMGTEGSAPAFPGARCFSEVLSVPLSGSAFFPVPCFKIMAKW